MQARLGQKQSWALKKKKLIMMGAVGEEDKV